MTRAYGSAVTAFLILACGCSRAAPKKPATDAEDVAETGSILDHVWLDAAHNHDGDTAAWLFADDFHRDSSREDLSWTRKTAGGHDWQHQTRRPRPFSHSDVQVRYASPDVAVLTDLTQRFHGKAGRKSNYDGQFRVMRVFVKQHGRWRAAGAGLARITAQSR